MKITFSNYIYKLNKCFEYTYVRDLEDGGDRCKSISDELRAESEKMWKWMMKIIEVIREEFSDIITLLNNEMDFEILTTSAISFGSSSACLTQITKVEKVFLRVDLGRKIWKFPTISFNEIFSFFQLTTQAFQFIKLDLNKIFNLLLSIVVFELVD